MRNFKYKLKLDGKTIYIYNSKEELQKKLEFPPIVYDNFQLLDPKDFRKTLVEYFGPLKIGGQVIDIVIDQSLTEQKDNQIIVLAYDYVKEVVDTLTKLNSKIISITVNTDNHPQVTDQFLKTSFEKQIEPTSAVNKKHFYDTKYFKYGMVGIIFVICTSLFVGMGGVTNIYNLFTPKKAQPIVIDQPVEKRSPEIAIESKEATSSSVLSATTSATPKLKSQLVIKVLNGTGQSGLAASISAQLKKSGFTKISTGNTQTTKNTTITYQPNISTKIVSEIEAILAKRFSNVQSSESSSSAEFDIEIVTGEQN